MGMGRLNRRRFLFIGLLSFFVVALGGLWRMARKVLTPGPGTLPPKRPHPEEARPPAPPISSNSPEKPAPAKPGEKEETAPLQEEKDEPQASWQRPLGSTGVMVSMFGLGGAGIIAQSHRQDDAVNLINRALDEGINYIDTAPTYGGAVSERHIGMAIKQRRKEVFLATKTLDRTYDGTMRLLEQSLKNLQTDTVDLYQVHGIRDLEDAEAVFKNNGVLKAMEELKREGVVRYLGITGHRAPEPLCHALERYPFDCVLMPLNPAEVFFQSFQDGLLPMALEKELGIIAMKVPAYGRLLRRGGIETMEEALGYVYTLPVSTAIVGISSMEQLEENIRITREFTPYSTTAMKNLESLARPYQEEANFYKVQW